MKDYLLSMSIEEITLYILALEFIAILLFIFYLFKNRNDKDYQSAYKLDCANALMGEYKKEIISLKENIHQGNIKFLEAKKEWLEAQYNILLTHKASVFQVKQDITKIEKQIVKLKSKIN